MARMTIATLILMFCTTPVQDAASAPHSDDCLLGLRRTLERGGYSGPFFCDPANVQFLLVGVAVTSAAKYSVYDYRYRFLPHRGGVWHGGQRMIILRNSNYFGQFSLDSLTTIKISGTELTLSKPDIEPAVVDLAKGVPAQVFFDGFLYDFFR